MLPTGQLLLSVLRDADPAAFGDAAAAFRATASRYTETQGIYKAQVLAQIDLAWHGSGADAAKARMSTTNDYLTAAAAELGNTATALDDVNQALTLAQQELRWALNLLTSLGYTVSEDGTVTPPTSIPEPVDATTHNATEATTLVAWALQSGYEADQQAAALLNSIASHTTEASGFLGHLMWETELASDTHNADALGSLLTGESIPKGRPEVAAAWWDSLTPAEQADYINHHADSIGNLDGLPSSVRSAVNKGRIQANINDLNGQWASVRAHGGTYAQLDAIQAKIDGLKTLRDRTADPNVYLLAFDPTGVGHYAVSYGNPDTAGNVVTYVPGTGAGFKMVGADMTRAQTLYGAANSVPGSRPTASIVWVGYDPPQTIPQDIPPGAEKGAERAADPLANFQNGLDAAHQGTVPANTTLLGHSYGSTAVGYTLASGKTHVDNVIFVGSPGIPVQHASDLGMAPDHVWAGAIKNDPVPLLSAPLDDHKWTDDHSLRYGIDPTSEYFGGQVFATGVADGAGDAHAAYWGPHDSHLEKGVTALPNMADIIAGMPGKVTRAPYGY